jgi:DNA-binding GntR family transcriptional regulator
MLRTNKADKSYIYIREKLIARALRPGERLVESVWASQIDVNRADVRQAFSRLVGEGLLRAGTKGVFVREFTLEDTRELNEIRLILETSAAELAIHRATAEDIGKLEDICDHMHLMAQNGYTLGVFEADLRFHQTFIDAAHNSRLKTLYQNANLPLSTNDHANNSIASEILIRDSNEHRMIVEALKNKDREKLRNLLSKALV